MEEVSKKKVRVYRVSARPRNEFSGFWRGGILFPNAPDYIELTEEQLTDAIRNEPMLIVQKLEVGDGIPADGE
jgi:hypothetical protein